MADMTSDRCEPDMTSVSKYRSLVNNPSSKLPAPYSDAEEESPGLFGSRAYGPLIGVRFPAAKQSGDSAADLNSRDDDGKTPLSRAAECGDEKTVKVFLAKEGIDLNNKDNCGRTPLLAAVENGRIYVAKRLLAANNVDINARDESGQTPLLWAVRLKMEAVTEILLSREGIDIAVHDKNGRTPLSWAAQKGDGHAAECLLALGDSPNSQDHNGQTPLSWALQNGHQEIAKLIFAKESANCKITNFNGPTPLFLAARFGSCEFAEFLLGQAWIDPDEKDAEGRTPLSFAAEAGHLEIASLLLNYKCVNLNEKDHQGWTPFDWAVMFKRQAIAKLLYEKYNASLKEPETYSPTLLSWAAQDENRETASLILDEYCSSEFSPTLLSWAARNGYLKMVELLLVLHYEADTKDAQGQTPLSLAAEIGYPKIIELLIDSNCEVDSQDKKGRTPLSWAARNGHLGIVKLLVNQHCEVDTRDKDGRTPLFLAAAHDHLEIVRLLLDQHCNVNEQDYQGLTPLSWAIQNRSRDAVKLLVNTPGVILGSTISERKKLCSWAIENKEYELGRRLFETWENIDKQTINSPPNTEPSEGKLELGIEEEVIAAYVEVPVDSSNPLAKSPVKLESPVIREPSSPTKPIFKIFLRVLSKLGLIEPPIPPFHQRLRWKNLRQAFYDDYVEHEPGALEALRQYLETSAYKSAAGSQATEHHNSPSLTAINSPRAMLTGPNNSVSNRQGNQGQLATSQNVRVSRFREDLEMTVTPTGSLHLLICMEQGRYSTQFCPENVTSVVDDRTLFRMLREKYQQQRGRFKTYWSLRRIQSIQFMKFTYGGHRHIDVRCHDSICEHGNTCKCVPPATLVRPNGSEYECSPLPSGFSPPIGERLLMSFFTDPDGIAPDSAMVLRQFPKRTSGIVKAEDVESIEAWGVCYKEGWDVIKIFVIIGVLFVLGSLLFGILWAILKQDIQSAFGIASWWLTAATIVVGIMGTRAWDANS